jgi:hypothetical protein
MPDEPEILDEVITPTQPIDRPGSPHVRGIGEGITIAVILVLIAGAMGFVAFGRPSASVAPSPSSITAAATATSQPSTAPASPTANPTVGPVVTPATACAATSPPTPPLAKIHYPGFRWYGTLASEAWLTDPAAAVPDPNDIASATTGLADPLIVSLDNRWCALAWRFELDGVPIAVQGNPALSPGYASQDAWSIRLPATTNATPLLRAELRFPLGWSVVTWRVTFAPSPIPDAFLASVAGTIAASPGCGFSLALRNGATGTDTCATTLPAGEPEHLLAGPDVDLAFRVPGATFEPDPDVPVLCGRVGGTPPDFDASPACVLDIGYDPSNALTFASPSEAGTWWLAIRGCATRDGNRACGRWYGIVDVVAPEGSPEPG